MSKLVRSPSSRSLLNRILSQPGLVEAVRGLAPRELAALIDRVGLEDSGELVALATIDQLKAVFDEDLWRNEKPGEQERLDAARFAVWLEVMLEAGAEFAASRLSELDEDFLAALISAHVYVLDLDELTLKNVGAWSSRSLDALTEKALESSLTHEIGGNLVLGRTHHAWDAIITLLAELDSSHFDFLERVLLRCREISREAIEDAGGLYEVLTAGERIEADLAGDRDDRRAAEGYVSPTQAREFLEAARAGTPDYVSGAWLKARGVPAERSRPRTAVSPADARENRLEQELGAAAPPDARVRFPRVAALLRGAERPGQERLMHEISFLANVLVAGSEVRDPEGRRRYRPAEAIEAVLAVCERGLGLLPEARDLVSAFRAAHREPGRQGS